MTTTLFFFIFIPLLAFILLVVNLMFAPHNPYQEKDSAFECGFHSFLGQNRTQFSISFFIFALLFLLFDLEILLVYPYIVSSYTNNIYGLIVMLIFFLMLTLGFAFELGKNALKIDSRQMFTIANKQFAITSVLAGLPLQSKGKLINCLSNLFTLPNLKRAAVIFITGYILRQLIFLVFGVMVFSDYVSNISKAYYLFMAFFSIFTQDLFLDVPNSSGISVAQAMCMCMEGIEHNPNATAETGIEHNPNSSPIGEKGKKPESSKQSSPKLSEVGSSSHFNIYKELEKANKINNIYDNPELSTKEKNKIAVNTIGGTSESSNSDDKTLKKIILDATKEKLAALNAKDIATFQKQILSQVADRKVLSQSMSEGNFPDPEEPLSITRVESAGKIRPDLGDPFPTPPRPVVVPTEPESSPVKEKSSKRLSFKKFFTGKK